MPRFVILEHDWPTRHWDLLLEDGDVLRAWRLLAEPEPGARVLAERNADHRKRYLDYEGPVSGGRGSVVRWDWGEFEWDRRTDDIVIVDLWGRKVAGPTSLIQDGDVWTCGFGTYVPLPNHRLRALRQGIGEAEWLAARSPFSLLGEVVGASDRIRRLFEVACCRRHWDAFDDEASRHAILVAERFADGLATAEELNANATAENRASGNGASAQAPAARREAVKVAARNVTMPVGNWKGFNVLDAPHCVLLGRCPDYHAEEAAQCELLRDIFGNPFRPVTLDPGWLTSTVVGIAEGIYVDRAFDRMPILADALQDAGCEDADLLVHCRRGGPHVRGCWVVDLVLGKD